MSRRNNTPAISCGGSATTASKASRKSTRRLTCSSSTTSSLSAGKIKPKKSSSIEFNALYENNKQIIISSNRPPQSIPTLEERLRSRFEGGLIADIAYPEFETRVAIIIKGKLQEMNRQLSKPVIDIIAKKLRKNIRELEGILKKILFYEERKQTEITEDITTITRARGSSNAPADHSGR